MNHNDHPLEELIRTDNMLAAEGLLHGHSPGTPSGESSENTAALDNIEYQTKLSQIGQIYKVESEKYENHCRDFTSHVKSLLREQSQFRPISESDIDRLLLIVQRKFSPVHLQLKQSTCEALMILRSRFLDAR